MFVKRLDNRTSWMTAAIGAYVIFCITFVITGIFKPAWDWDMLAYVAETFETEPGATPESIHRDTYDIVHQRVSEEDWRMLTTINDYRVEQLANPDSFISMLGMYRIKLGYEIVLRAISKLVDPVVGSMIISLAAGLALAVIIAMFLGRWRRPELLLLSIPVLILAELPLLARVPTPDMLASLFLIAGLICLLRAMDWLAAVLFVIAVAVRPDYIVFAGLLPFAFVLIRKWPPLPYLVSLAGSVAVYFIALKLADYPGWWPHFVFAIIDLQPTMEGFDPAFSVGTYATGLIKGIVKVFGWQTWPWIGVASAFALLYFPSLRAQLDGRILVAFAALVTTLVAKFVLFPIMDNRIYMAFVVGLALLVAEAVARSQSEEKAFDGGGKALAR